MTTPTTCLSTPPSFQLDTLDRQLLDIIQSGFPIASRPYAVIAAELGMDEQAVLDRVRRLRAAGIIRRIGGNFQSSRLGFCSTLCAAKVPEEQFDAVAAHINSYPGVTHNYQRAHVYNQWFTLIAPSRADARATLDAMTAHTGIDILDLPATKLYKIKVDFPMQAMSQDASVIPD